MERAADLLAQQRRAMLPDASVVARKIVEHKAVQEANRHMQTRTQISRWDFHELSGYSCFTPECEALFAELKAEHGLTLRACVEVSPGIDRDSHVQIVTIDWSVNP